jgi:alkanesulfonate monooxygenase SsuD/methylene tetrahydromethanopterin reductase-like flavin-dependent oxidoreductase (luciferase family)
MTASDDLPRSATSLRLGITYVPYLDPEHLRDLAQAAQECGLDDLWVWEDCFKQSGVAAAAAALAWTDTIRVGIGLLPVPLRNVALTAMEIATLGRLFPGRLLPGIGHGVQPWMEQVGGRVSSPLTLLREYATALRSLLAGDEVTVDGRYVGLDAVTLDWPPADPPLLAMGGDGPKSVALAGELGDVYLLSAARTDAEIATAYEIATAARQRRDPAAGALPMVSAPITATGPGARARVDAEIPFWGKEPDPGIGSAGDAEQVAEDFRRLAGLGVTTVAVQPTRDEPDLLGLVEFLGREVKPLLAAG